LFGTASLMGSGINGNIAILVGLSSPKSTASLMGSGINGNAYSSMLPAFMAGKPLPLWEVELMETKQANAAFAIEYSLPLPLWEVELMETVSYGVVIFKVAFSKTASLMGSGINGN
jgi:hypothetical protein